MSFLTGRVPQLPTTRHRRPRVLHACHILLPSPPQVAWQVAFVPLSENGNGGIRARGGSQVESEATNLNLGFLDPGIPGSSHRLLSDFRIDVDHHTPPFAHFRYRTWVVIRMEVVRIYRFGR